MMSRKFTNLVFESAIEAHLLKNGYSKGDSKDLERDRAWLDVVIGKIAKAIDLLREFSTALISAAVTGKIDVRKEVA